MLERSGVGGFPMRTRDLVSIQVDLHPVADLINRKTSPIPTDVTFLTSNDPGDYEACRALADRLRFEGYVAILSPSAAMPGGVNLNIYIDGIAGNIILQDGEDRIPIDPHLIKLSP